eukprot:CAMPEP_0172502006 /NCGR_PEP_ID=MMETSP1066-20121228/155668_1 /TAXON_ID=671091 /ORGANISM="Coscinodiscus wailesii, Strain CCMP2513" /LENGTH=667 /DNA_ID=CAMNT_0013277103 /DNA_START=82 /DNA_END=2085 /DNA_ORIENTATION=+
MARGEQQSSNESSINVAIRLRPLNNRELSSTNLADRAWRAIPETNSIIQLESAPSLKGISSPSSVRRSSSSLFTYDRAFGEDTTTRDVYDGVAKCIVDGVVSGLNGTIFAYGQTSSGKTYTMQGRKGMENEGGEEGIIQMAARDIFGHVADHPDREYLIRTSFLEIYNEQVRDLLSQNERESLAVREDPKRGVVVNCKEVVVTDLESLLNVLHDGEKNRQVAFTNMNATSSRSHTIFRVTIESREGIDDVDSDDEGGAVLISTLNLVDLAGSESVKHTGATGQRQREGGKINQSLLTLSQVISTLASSKKQFVNYRDSKLTRLLQSSLSGNALMSVICCATPSCNHIEETKSTLKFASRAKLVKMKAEKNEVIDDRALIKRLQKELFRLRNEMEEQQKELKKQRGEEKVNPVEEDDVEDKLNFLKSMILNGAFEDDFNSPGKANKRRRPSLLAESLPPTPAVRPLKNKRKSGDTLSTSMYCSTTPSMDMFNYNDHHNVSLTFCSPTKVSNPSVLSPDPVILFSDSVNHFGSPDLLRKSSEQQLTSENSILKKALACKSEEIAELQRQLQMRLWDVNTLKEENNELKESLMTSSTTELKQYKKYDLFQMLLHRILDVALIFFLCMPSLATLPMVTLGAIFGKWVSPLLQTLADSMYYTVSTNTIESDE